jgi:hypothetical protein
LEAASLCGPHFQPVTPQNIDEIAGFDCEDIDGK